ncbi:membrane cofactor protein-like [Ciona intestinalis]
MTSCVNGRWNIDVNKAHCHDVTCDPPPPVEHGRIITTGGFRVNSTVTYNCDEGYWFRRDHWTMTLTCLASGDWNIEIKYIACIRITCHEAYPTHFGYFVNRGAMYTDTTRYYCNRGFRINGDSLAICNHRGRWEPHNITCERKFVY